MTLLALNYSIKLKWTTCCVCDAPIAMADDLYDRRLNDHDWFYCPRGHRQYFTGKSEAQRLQEEKEGLEEQLERQRTKTRWAERSAQHAKNSARTLKGHLTRKKKRAAAGVCPCCNRTFKALARHMANKHPEYGGNDDDTR